MRNNLHPLMKQRASWNNANPLSGRAGWVADLGPQSRSRSSVNRGLKPWVGLGDSGAAQILPVSSRYHL